MIKRKARGNSRLLHFRRQRIPDAVAPIERNPRAIAVITGGAGFFDCGSAGIAGRGSCCKQDEEASALGLTSELFTDLGKAGAVEKTAVFRDVVDGRVGAEAIESSRRAVGNKKTAGSDGGPGEKRDVLAPQ